MNPITTMVTAQETKAIVGFLVLSHTVTNTASPVSIEGINIAGPFLILIQPPCAEFSVLSDRLANPKEIRAPLSSCVPSSFAFSLGSSIPRARGSFAGRADASPHRKPPKLPKT